MTPVRLAVEEFSLLAAEESSRRLVMVSLLPPVGHLKQCIEKIRTHLDVIICNISHNYYQLSHSSSLDCDILHANCNISHNYYQLSILQLALLVRVVTLQLC